MDNQPLAVQEDPPTQPPKRPEYADKIKIRCRHCGHRTAIRRYVINNIREAVYVCENCHKPVKR